MSNGENQSQGWDDGREEKPQVPPPHDPEPSKGQLSTIQKRMQDLRLFVDRHRVRATITKLLPPHLNAERVMASAFNAVSRNPDLLNCTPSSFVRAIIESCSCGLEPGKARGGTHLVPFFNKRTQKKEVQMIADYRGLIKLAYQSDQVASAEAFLVHEKDEFEMILGTTTTIRHKPYEQGDPGPVRLAYFVAYLKRAERPIVNYMLRRDLEAIHDRSKAKDAGPWRTDEEMMMLKTMFRRGVNYLPQSEQLDRAITYDQEAADIEIPSPDPEVQSALDAMDISDTDFSEPAKESRTETLKEKLKSEKPGS